MPHALSLAYLLDLYIRHKLPLCAASTRYKYSLSLRYYAEFLRREPLLTDLEDSQVTECCGWLLRTRKLSPASVSKFRDCICAAWRFGARKRIEGITAEPDVPEIVEPKRIPVAWTRDELARLWGYISRMPGDVAGIPASDWFCSLHAVLWDTGERIGAILATEWQQVDLHDGWIVVRAETRKGCLADKLSRLHPATVELLERIRLPQRKLVWPWPWNRFSLWRQYGQILDRAGLPSGRERKFHCLRKSCASHITALGGNAQEALGHSDARTTRDHYIDPRIAGQQFPADILPRLGHGDSGVDGDSVPALTLRAGVGVPDSRR